MLDLPRLACFTAYDYLTDAAVYLLRDRERKYPAEVTAGRMTAAQSADGMELMRVLVAQWRWVIDKARPALPDFDCVTGRFGVANRVLAAEVQKIAATSRARADRAPDDWKRREMADLFEALAWYQHDDCGDPRIVWHHLDREAVALSVAA